MRYILNLISFVILAMIVGLGSLALGTGQARAGIAPCAIGIEKIEIPDDDTPFDFSVSGDQSFGFVLSDPSDDTRNFGMGTGQTVTVTEIGREGWTLDSIECTEGTSNCGMVDFVPCLSATVDGNSVTFFCEDNDTASCVFTNVKTAGVVPTLSEWGLIAMAGILGIAGFIVAMRRRKVTA
jgi:hypothetical protein